MSEFFFTLSKGSCVISLQHICVPVSFTFLLKTVFVFLQLTCFLSSPLPPLYFLYFTLPLKSSPLDLSSPTMRVSLSMVEVCVLQETDEEGSEGLLCSVFPWALLHSISPRLRSGCWCPHAPGWLAVHSLHHLPQTQSTCSAWGITQSPSHFDIFTTLFSVDTLANFLIALLENITLAFRTNVKPFDKFGLSCF